MKKKEELLKNLDMKSLKALLLDNVKKLLLEELKRKVKDSRIEMQLIIDKSSNEFKEKQKIFNGLFASLKSAKEKTENLKGLIEEKLKTFEPFIKEMEELAIKGLDYKSLLEKIVEPIKKRFEKEFKEVLRDKKLQFEQLKALKILIEKDSKATLDDLKAMKSYIENYLQEKSQDFNDQMTQISDKTNLEYYRLNSMKNEMEAQINKGVDIEFIKKFIMREFKLEFERYLLEESHKLKQELLIIIDSGSEEYKKLEHKIHDIENKLRNGVFYVKEIKDRVLGQLKLIEPFIKDLEAQL